MEGYKLLKLDSFTTAINTADKWSEIAYFDIPRERIYALLDNHNIELYLYTKETFSGDGSTTTFTLSNEIVDSEILPDNKGAVLVFVGGTQTDVTVNYSAHQITFSSAPASGTDNIVVYYLFKDGQVEIRAVAPVGTSGIYRPLFNDSINRVHLLNQFDIRQKIKLHQAIALPEDFRISVRIKSSVVVNWDSANYLPRITIPYIDMDLNDYIAKSEKVNSKQELFDSVLKTFIS